MLAMQLARQIECKLYYSHSEEIMAGFYMDERFGAWQVGDDPNQGAVQFKLFFPDRAKSSSQYVAHPNKPNYGNPQIASIRVVGDFMRSLGLQSWIGSIAPPLLRDRIPK